ncbi:MAG: HAMP domain-containing sensor histidine kinase [Verrucomicrobiota bacterium]
MRYFFKSIRWQLQAWYGLLLFAVPVLFSGIYYQIVRAEKIGEIDRRLEDQRIFILDEFRKAVFEQVDPLSLAEKINSETPFEVLIETVQSASFEVPSRIASEFGGDDPGYYFFHLEDRNGNLIARSDNADEGFEFPEFPVEGFNIDSRYVGNVREVLVTHAFGMRLAVGQEISSEIREMRQFRGRAFLIGLGVWFFGLFGGWLIVGRFVKPIGAISDAAARISEGNLADRIQVRKTGNELDELASVLNTTFDKLQAMVESQRRFTADASHELRTPLSVILSESHRMKKGERTEEERQESLDLTLLAGGRMKKLVEDLLLLARQDSTELHLELEELQVHELVGEIVASHQSLAEQKEIKLISDLQPVRISSDAMKLTIALSNLIGNAVSHHVGKGSVWISLIREGANAVISIKDDGPGISEQDLPHIFDRFYRVEKARSAVGGHSGLGLALVESVVRQLGGTIDVVSESGKGSTFSIRIPLGNDEAKVV